MSKQEIEQLNSFGKYLKSMREMKGLSMKDVAEKTGITISYLNRLENFKRKKPSLKVIQKLSETLDISIIDLLKFFLEIEDKQTKSLGEMIQNEYYLIDGKEVPSEVRVILWQIVEIIMNIEWKDSNSYNFSEELRDKIKRINDIW